jgi:hypothetical protein
MEKKVQEGSLADTPFPLLLFSLWKAKNSGQLRISSKPHSRLLFFKKGELMITDKNISDDELKKTLLERKSLNTFEIENIETYQSKRSISFIKALTELEFLSPGYIWGLIEDIFRSDIYPVFDWKDGKYELEPEKGQQKQLIFHSLSTLDLIIQGIRQMRDFSRFQILLPTETEILQTRLPDYADKIRLDSPEIYIFGLFETPKTTKTALEMSELSERETQKILFSLFCLGYLVPSHTEKKNALPEKAFPNEISKTVDTFNKKCSYIFKYVSKEIGPVALNVMTKCLDEAKANLSPLFKEIRLGKNGIIETVPSLIGNFRTLDEEARQDLLHGLNEILASEVLAVKRTLGNKHESTLVQNLEKIGE